MPGGQEKCGISIRTVTEDKPLFFDEFMARSFIGNAICLVRKVLDSIFDKLDQKNGARFH